MAVVGSGQTIDEGEVDDLGDATEEMAGRNKTVERKLVVELGGEPAVTHHELLPPPGGGQPIWIISLIRS
jgi:hypothetical protein